MCGTGGSRSSLLGRARDAREDADYLCGELGEGEEVELEWEDSTGGCGSFRCAVGGVEGCWGKGGVSRSAGFLKVAQLLGCIALACWQSDTITRCSKVI